MDVIELDITSDPDAARAVREGLAAYNRSRVEDDGYRELTVFLRDPDRAVVGGLLGDTYWGWLSINIVWVAESLRGQGYGRALLAMAEREALQRGCHHAHLDTMSFQARPFYEREGYTVFGALHDVPMGHSRYFMQKNLSLSALLDGEGVDEPERHLFQDGAQAHLLHDGLPAQVRPCPYDRPDPRLNQGLALQGAAAPGLQQLVARREDLSGTREFVERFAVVRPPVVKD